VVVVPLGTAPLQVELAEVVLHQGLILLYRQHQEHLELEVAVGALVETHNLTIVVPVEPVLS
jgi:hypothetical protein